MKKCGARVTWRSSVLCPGNYQLWVLTEAGLEGLSKFLVPVVEAIMSLMNSCGPLGRAA